MLQFSQDGCIRAMMLSIPTYGKHHCSNTSKRMYRLVSVIANLKRPDKKDFRTRSSDNRDNQPWNVTSLYITFCRTWSFIARGISVPASRTADAVAAISKLEGSGEGLGPAADGGKVDSRILKGINESMAMRRYRKLLMLLLYKLAY